jgi:ribosome-associated protein
MGDTAPRLPKGPEPGLADVEAVLNKILGTLDDAKAEDVVSIPLAERSTLADFMVIASGRSQRHVDAIAQQVVEALGKIGRSDVRVEGRPHCEWVLIDEGSIIVHIFHPDMRSFYNLEKMWSPSRPSERSVA